MSESILNVIPEIVIYGKPDCVYCDKAKEAFDSVEISYQFQYLGPAVGMPDVAGESSQLPDDWRESGMVELQAMWVMCGEPVPFIVIDGRGYKNLSAALDAISYRDRKKLIVARKRREQSKETDSRTDA
jgi:hypothetical protein